jgi:hypothetical protein
LAVPSQQALEQDGDSRSYELLRSEEDWSFLRDPGKRTDIFDPIKFIPLDEEGRIYLTLGGEARIRYEYFHDPDWGAGPDRDGALLQRYMLHADLHAGPHLRLFGHLKSGLENGRAGGPEPPDEDRLDLHELFIDGRLPLAAEDALVVRLGRQELQYGSSRLVSPREGPNVRRSFDAARARLRLGGGQADAFVSRPVETEPGVFDDGPDENQAFWGLYTVAPEGFLRGVGAEFYYLGLDRDDAEFDQGVAHEVRHSLGTRLFGDVGDLDYNFEFVYQFGRFGHGDIQAWTAASDTGYTFRQLPGRPRLGLRADVASGDRHPSDPDLGTFNALFPKGSYFSETGLIGPANFFDLHPMLSVAPSPGVVLLADWDFFWRYSTRDGLYGPSLTLVRSGQTSDERYVGSQLSLSVEWQIQEHLELVLFYAHFFAGPFLEEAPPGEDVDFFGTWLTFKF